ncbi:MAG: response regulator transcription factor [Chloroflexota bacterium]|nr:response regulator transcription factor [Chloroflexota bacterium]
MIRAMLVDDHALLREGTRALLETAPDIEIVDETGRGEEALELAHRLAPDVVLLDIKLQGLGGIDVARALRQDLPEIKVLMLSAYNTEQYVRALFAIGVHGYLLKSATGPELTEAVRAVCRGETVLSAEIASRIVSGTRRSGIAASDTLSDREREVLELVGRGASNKEIAASLALSTRTVEKHVSGAMAKLSARSRTEAIKLAVQRGIIALE